MVVGVVCASPPASVLKPQWQNVRKKENKRKTRGNTKEKQKNKNTKQNTCVFLSLLVFFCVCLFCPDGRSLILSRLYVFVVPFAFFCPAPGPEGAPKGGALVVIWLSSPVPGSAMIPRNREVADDQVSAMSALVKAGAAPCTECGAHR